MNLKNQFDQSKRIEPNDKLWNSIEASRSESRSAFRFEGYKVAAIFSLLGLMTWYSLTLGKEPVDLSDSFEFYTQELDETDEYAFLDEFYESL